MLGSASRLIAIVARGTLVNAVDGPSNLVAQVVAG
jgi:hypothetical protein